MPATWELLPEIDARQKLETFVGNVATAGEVSNWDGFLEVVGDTELPTAARSLIAHHGRPNINEPEQIRVINNRLGWHLLAVNHNRSLDISTSIWRRWRPYKIGPRHDSLVLFQNSPIERAEAYDFSSQEVAYLPSINVRYPSREQLTGFLRISSQLVSDLLTVTAAS